MITPMITTINEFKKILENNNYLFNHYQKTDGTIYFRNFTQKMLWDFEISGQISDGYWENSSGASYIFWTSLETSVDSLNPRVEANIVPQRINYNLSNKELLDIVGDRMLAIGKMSKITKDTKIINASEYLESFVFDKTDKQGKIDKFNLIKNDSSDYRFGYLKLITEELFEQWLDVNYTMSNLRSDLNDMKDIMKTAASKYDSSSEKTRDKLARGFTSKDTTRIEGIINKANGNKEKQEQLARSMASKIKDGRKALQRGRAAEDENYHDIAQIFFDRAKEIGIVENNNN